MLRRLKQIIEKRRRSAGRPENAAPLLPDGLPVGTEQMVKSSGAGAQNANVSFAVAVVIAVIGNVALNGKAQGITEFDYALVIAAGFFNPPGRAERTTRIRLAIRIDDDHIGAAVTHIVANSHILVIGSSKAAPELRQNRGAGLRVGNVKSDVASLKVSAENG